MMISNRFENTKPANLLLVFLAVVFGYCLYEFFVFQNSWDWKQVLQAIGSWLLLLGSMIFLNIIDRWNELTQNNSYSLLFFGVFTILFPDVYNNLAILGANLLIIIAMWRIIALRTEENVSQKIFDASLFIICASLLNTWALFFLLNVWISLLFYGSKKRKYWLIPFFAVFSVAVLFSTVLVLTGFSYAFPTLEELKRFDYERFTQAPILFSLVVVGLMLLVSLAVYIFKTKYHSGSSQVVIQFLLVGTVAVFFSKEPIYIFAQQSILFALYVEQVQKKWLKETILWVLLTIPIAVLLLHFISKS